MGKKVDIITLLSEGHNFYFHGFWRATDMSKQEIYIESGKPIDDLYKAGETVEISLFPVEFPAISIRCSFSYIDQSEFELKIIDFPSLKDRQLYTKLLASRFYSKNAISSNKPIAEKPYMYAH